MSLVWAPIVGIENAPAPLVPYESAETLPPVQTFPSWKRTRLMPCGREGYAFVAASVVQGRAVVAGTVADKAVGGRIWRVEVKYQLQDSRFRRGLTVMAGDTQEG